MSTAREGPLDKITKILNDCVLYIKSYRPNQPTLNAHWIRYHFLYNLSYSEPDIIRHDSSIYWLTENLPAQDIHKNFHFVDVHCTRIVIGSCLFAVWSGWEVLCLMHCGLKIWKSSIDFSCMIWCNEDFSTRKCEFCMQISFFRWDFCISIHLVC